ncbi:UNVERIFIED_CONTAM: hypothetical protein QO022_07325 [Pseudomonas aeruginosa]
MTILQEEFGRQVARPCRQPQKPAHLGKMRLCHFGCSGLVRKGRRSRRRWQGRLVGWRVSRARAAGLLRRPQPELSRQHTPHKAEQVGHGVAYSTQPHTGLQLVQHRLPVLTWQTPQGGLHVAVLVWSHFTQA